MKDGIRESRTAGIERRLVAATHDQKLAMFGGLLAAAERNIEQGNTGAVGGTSLQLAHGRRRNGRGNSNHAAIGCTGKNTVIAEHHRFDL